MASFAVTVGPWTIRLKTVLVLVTNRSNTVNKFIASEVEKGLEKALYVGQI